MKRFLLAALVALMVLCLSTGVLAENTGALDAFNALTGQQAQTNNPAKTNAEYLSEIMAGVYANSPADLETAAVMAVELPFLSEITNRDIASFSSANRHPVRMVRNAYYIALANVLRAEIMINPASEEHYRNVQIILALFLEENEEKIDYSARETIRSSMTPADAAVIAAEYNLPVDFVEFVVMDDDWDDDNWANDDDWRDELGWDDDDLYDDSPDDLTIGDKDSANSTRIADLQTRLIALGYLNGKADGVFGPATQAALMQYQLAN
ncbi:MAG: peptidoglycan-binding domain-containing protein, partial [Eubacteriales bacterium]|nr:peptidoglycan-binding domain-containing protein [Eubacteriales bacterium]